MNRFCSLAVLSVLAFAFATPSFAEQDDGSDICKSYGDRQSAACADALQRCRQEADAENVDPSELGDYLRECVDSLIADDSQNDVPSPEQDDGGNMDTPDIQDTPDPETENRNAL